MLYLSSEARRISNAHFAQNSSYVTSPFWGQAITFTLALTNGAIAVCSNLLSVWPEVFALCVTSV